MRISSEGVYKFIDCAFSGTRYSGIGFLPPGISARLGTTTGQAVLLHFLCRQAVRVETEVFNFTSFLKQFGFYDGAFYFTWFLKQSGYQACGVTRNLLLTMRLVSP